MEGRLPVLVEGGIRRGSDVARALALGARGVAHVVDTLDARLARTLALLGARTPGELGPDLLAPLPGASYLPPG